MSNPIFLIVAPLIGTAIALIGKVLPAKRLFSVLAVLPLGAMVPVLVASLPSVLAGQVITTDLGGWAPPLGIRLVLDGLSWLSTAIVVVVAVPVSLASLSRFSYGPSFYVFFTGLIAGMQMVILTADLFSLFVGFEVVAIAAYVLIAFERNDQALLASIKYLILSSVGILFFLFGVFLVYRDLGTLAIPDIQAMAGPAGFPSPAVDTRSIHLAVAALTVGIGVRTAFIPFHTWLPEAHAYAPHPVSALLSGALIKVSFFGLVRILRTFNAVYLWELLMWVGVATAVAAGVWALAQTDAKRLLAYSSVSQMGFLLAAIGAVAPGSTAAAFSHAINHALFKGLAFLVVGFVLHTRHERNILKIKSIAKEFPLAAVALIVAALSIAALPPFGAFASKQLIGAAVGGPVAYWALAVAGITSFGGALKLSRPAWPALPALGRRDSVGPSDKETHARPARRPGVLMAVAFAFLALGSLAAGIFADELTWFLRSMVGDGGAEIGSWYSREKIIEVAAVSLLGVGAYFLSVSRVGRAFSRKIVEKSPDIGLVLILFILGLALFAIIAFLG